MPGENPQMHKENMQTQREPSEIRKKINMIYLISIYFLNMNTFIILLYRVKIFFCVVFVELLILTGCLAFLFPSMIFFIYSHSIFSQISLCESFSVNLSVSVNQFPPSQFQTIQIKSVVIKKRQSCS